MQSFILAVQNYKHLKFYNPILTLKTFLWGIYGGLLIGIAISYYNKVFIGGFIRRLLKNDAVGADSAKSFSELDIKVSPLLRHALKKNTELKRYAVIANKEDAVSVSEPSAFSKKLRRFFGKNESIIKYDLDKANFFVPEEFKYRAEILYDKKGANPMIFIISALVLTALVFAANLIIPDLLTMLDNFIEIAVQSE